MRAVHNDTTLLALRSPARIQKPRSQLTKSGPNEFLEIIIDTRANELWLPVDKLEKLETILDKGGSESMKLEDVRVTCRKPQPYTESGTTHFSGRILRRMLDLLKSPHAWHAWS